jgi:hypothetical protein
LIKGFGHDHCLDLCINVIRSASSFSDPAKKLMYNKQVTKRQIHLDKIPADLKKMFHNVWSQMKAALDVN